MVIVSNSNRKFKWYKENVYLFQLELGSKGYIIMILQGINFPISRINQRTGRTPSPLPIRSVLHNTYIHFRYSKTTPPPSVGQHQNQSLGQYGCPQYPVKHFKNYIVSVLFWQIYLCFVLSILWNILKTISFLYCFDKPVKHFKNYIVSVLLWQIYLCFETNQLLCQFFVLTFSNKVPQDYRYLTYVKFGILKSVVKLVAYMYLFLYLILFLIFIIFEIKKNVW